MINKYIMAGAVFISASAVSGKNNDHLNGVPLLTNILDSSTDIHLQQTNVFGDILPGAENIYTIDMHPEEPLTFSKAQAVQSLTVNFRTQSQIEKVVKATQLKLILPEGVVRQGDIQVRCSQHADCKSEFVNSWTGKEGHQLILMAG